MIDPRSLDAVPPAGAEQLFCSWGLGWRSVLLRGYREPSSIECHDPAPTSDQKIVLVAAGSCRIESQRGGRWHRASYRPGHLGLVEPEATARLRWRGGRAHRTLQLHLPGRMVGEIAHDLFGGGEPRTDALRSLCLVDPAVAAAVRALEQAARCGAPELHAETTAHFLLSHLLVRSGTMPAPVVARSTDTALSRVDDYLRADLSRPVSLDELSRIADLPRFRLLRMARRAWGETPQRRLFRWRMELACRLLRFTDQPVVGVALECGYGNPAHFATAFRRATGRAPSQYRRGG